MPLNLLVELAQKPLPAAVTCPRELRHITLLKATGLIEATLAISHTHQRSTRGAFVHSITKDGEQEIADATGEKPSAFGWYEQNNLALEFLRFLELVDFPVIVSEKQECESAAILLRAGLIHGAVHEDIKEAVIRGLTEVGRDFFSRRHGRACTSAPRPVTLASHDLFIAGEAASPVKGTPSARPQSVFGATDLGTASSLQRPF